MEQKKEDKKPEAKKAEKTDEIANLQKKMNASELGLIRSQLAEKQQKVDELTDTLKRLAAEFENYKKWHAKEKAEFVKYSHAELIAKILPVLDSFEIALKSTKIEDSTKIKDFGEPKIQKFSSFLDAKNPKDFLANTGGKEKFVEGIKIIYAQFHSALEAEGLRPIKAVGEKFDPYKHEVLMKEESEKEEGTILEEFQKGYMLNDKVLRHSKVKISGK